MSQAHLGGSHCASTISARQSQRYVYFYRLEADDDVSLSKVFMLKQIALRSKSPVFKIRGSSYDASGSVPSIREEKAFD